MNHLERLIDVSRRQQEMLRDAATDRLSMTTPRLPRERGRWIDRLLAFRTVPAV